MDSEHLEGHWAIFQGKTTYLISLLASIRQQLMFAPNHFTLNVPHNTTGKAQINIKISTHVLGTFIETCETPIPS